MTDGYTREQLLQMKAEVLAAKEQLKEALAGQPPKLLVEGACGDEEILTRLGQAACARFDTWRGLVRSLVLGGLFSVYISDPGGGATLVFQKLSAWVEGLLSGGR